MSDEPNSPLPSKSVVKKNSFKRTIIGLVLAFVPSLLLLSMKDMFGLDARHRVLFWLAFAVSLVCCILSAWLLTQRKVVWAALIGVLFFVLNLLISLFIGCNAAISS